MTQHERGRGWGAVRRRGTRIQSDRPGQRDIHIPVFETKSLTGV